MDNYVLIGYAAKLSAISFGLCIINYYLFQIAELVTMLSLANSRLAISSVSL